MDKLERLGRLRKLVEIAGGEIEGRKKLHKLAYLCQQVGTDLGQSFMFYMYGVYSPSLAQDVEAAVEWNLIVERPSGEGHVISCGPENLEPADSDLRTTEAGFEVVKNLANQSPAMLEVVSTIVYLRDAGYCGADLEKKLSELKGHLSVLFPQATELAKTYFNVDVDGAAVKR